VQSSSNSALDWSVVSLHIRISERGVEDELEIWRYRSSLNFKNSVQVKIPWSSFIIFYAKLKSKWSSKKLKNIQLFNIKRQNSFLQIQLKSFSDF